MRAPPRLQRHASDLGVWELARAAPDPALAPYLVELTGYREEVSTPLVRRELPWAGFVLLINFAAPFEVRFPESGGAWRSFGCFLAGLHDRVAFDRPTGRSWCLQANLTPLGGLLLLRQPLGGLANRVVPLDEVLGNAAEPLAGRLAELPDWSARFALVQALLRARLAAERGPLPLLAEAWRRLAASGGRLPVARLAAQLGCSRQHLSALFATDLGMAPKRLARLVRFERATAALERGQARAELALDLGYADQAHFTREFQAFAGLTPGAYLAQRLPDGDGAAGT